LNFDLSDYLKDDAPRTHREPPKEQVLYNKWGKAVYRLREGVLYDYRGRPRGFIVVTTVYDLRGEHRGFWRNFIVSDRMRRVIGFAFGARIEGLVLPPIEIPPLSYRDLPAPELPAGAVALECPAFLSAWSMMQFENLLPSFEDDEAEKENL